jgi:type IV pilus assembly protein PilW
MKAMVEKSNRPMSQKGFTIVELLVAMAISLVVMAAIYSTYQSQQHSYIIQDQVAAAQQNLRAAMYTMTRDIQMAGFDPTYGVTPNRNLFGITTAGVDTVAFTADLARNATPAGQDITYSVNAAHELTRNAGGNAQVLAKNIYGLGLAYAYDAGADGAMDLSANNHIVWAVDTDGDLKLDLSLDTDDDGIIALNDDTNDDKTIEGTVLAPTVPLARIKSVKIWLLARTENPIQGYSVNNSYVVGRNIVTADPKYMYRILTETVKCRNL